MSLSSPEEAELLPVAVTGLDLGASLTVLTGCFLEGRGFSFLKRVLVVKIRSARRVDSKG